MPNKNSSSQEDLTTVNIHKCPISLEEPTIANANDFILVKVITGADSCSYYFIQNLVQNQFFGLDKCPNTRAKGEYKALYLKDLSAESKAQVLGLKDTSEFNLFLANEELQNDIKIGSFTFKTVATNPATTLQEFKNLLTSYPLQKHAIIDPANNESLLYYFANNNKTEFVTALIDAGVSINNTALHEAAKNGETEEVNSLIAGGADIKAKDNDGKTALHAATQLGKTKTALALITHGAEKEAIDDNGKTPLHLAAANGHTETALALITHDAEKETIDDNGKTPLHLAAENGHTETVTALIEARADIEAKDNNGLTPLHLAAANGHTETVTALIEARADIEAKDNNGFTTLHGAAANGHTSTVNALIAANADINARSYGGLTPLHWAVYKGHTETVKVLINHGACDKGLWGLLLGATLSGKTKVVKAVMTHKISNIARSVRQLLPTPSLRGICCNHPPSEANQFYDNIETFIATSGNHPAPSLRGAHTPTALAQGGSDAAMTGIKETTAKADSKNLI
jgi:ankyrin repeat protein